MDSKKLRRLSEEKVSRRCHSWNLNLVAVVSQNTGLPAVLKVVDRIKNSRWKRAGLELILQPAGAPMSFRQNASDPHHAPALIPCSNAATGVGEAIARLGVCFALAC